MSVMNRKLHSAYDSLLKSNYDSTKINDENKRK